MTIKIRVGPRLSYAYGYVRGYILGLFDNMRGANR